MAVWNSLTSEIQGLVLGQLADACRTKKGPTRGLAPYATVSKSWQSFFEAKTFHHFTLSEKDISTFDSIMIPKKRWLVKHVELRFVARLGGGSPSTQAEVTLRIAHKDRLFTCAVQSLLQVLSIWEVNVGGCHAGLTLEFSA